MENQGAPTLAMTRRLLLARCCLYACALESAAKAHSAFAAGSFVLCSSQGRQHLCCLVLTVTLELWPRLRLVRRRGGFWQGGLLCAGGRCGCELSVRHT
jgi:hypothetical protein